MEPVNWFLLSQDWFNADMLERTRRVPDKPAAWLLSQSVSRLLAAEKEEGKLPVRLL